MEDISLVTDNSLKMMLKTLQQRTGTKTQYGTGNAVTENKPIAISSRAEQGVYETVIWIKTMSAKWRPFMTGSFTVILL